MFPSFRPIYLPSFIFLNVSYRDLLQIHFLQYFCLIKWNLWYNFKYYVHTLAYFLHPVIKWCDPNKIELVARMWCFSILPCNSNQIIKFEQLKNDDNYGSACINGMILCEEGSWRAVILLEMIMLLMAFWRCRRHKCIIIWVFSGAVLHGTWVYEFIWLLSNLFVVLSSDVVWLTQHLLDWSDHAFVNTSASIWMHILIIVL